VTKHVKDICTDIKQYNFADILKDLQEYKLAVLTDIHGNLHKLELLPQQQKENTA